MTEFECRAIDSRQIHHCSILLADLIWFLFSSPFIPIPFHPLYPFTQISFPFLSLKIKFTLHSVFTSDSLTDLQNKQLSRVQMQYSKYSWMTCSQLNMRVQHWQHSSSSIRLDLYFGDSRFESRSRHSRYLSTQLIRYCNISRRNNIMSWYITTKILKIKLYGVRFLGF
jgi:hypothetical protein